MKQIKQPLVRTLNLSKVTFHREPVSKDLSVVTKHTRLGKKKCKSTSFKNVSLCLICLT